MMSNTKRCPACGAWVPLPLRHAQAAFERHIKTEHPDTWARQQAAKAELLGVTDALAPKRQPDASKLAAIRDELATAQGLRKAQLTSQLRRLEAQQ